MSLSALRPAPPRESLREHVHQALSAAIVSGELEAGTLITVPTLAVRFDVSATPVREAVLELEKRGFVETVRNKGFRVTAVSDEELGHLVQVRQLLEAPAMERLAVHLPEGALTGSRRSPTASSRARARGTSARTSRPTRSCTSPSRACSATPCSRRPSPTSAPARASSASRR